METTACFLQARLGKSPGHATTFATLWKRTMVSQSLPRPLPDLLVACIAHRFRVLGQPTRIRLLDHLEDRGETNVQALADELAVTQQNASRHLGMLMQAGLVVRRREGRVVWYRVADVDPFGQIETTAVDVMREIRRSTSSD